MKKRDQAGVQPGLFDEPPAVPLPQAQSPEDRDERYIRGLIEQIQRDYEYLVDPEGMIEEDPAGVEFYEQRILDYREEVKKVRQRCLERTAR